MHYWGYGWSMGWMMVSWLVWILIIALLVWVLFRVIARPAASDDSPETILKRRYARGEIDREEYERRLSDIRR